MHGPGIVKIIDRCGRVLRCVPVVGLNSYWGKVVVGERDRVCDRIYSAIPEDQGIGRRRVADVYRSCECIVKVGVVARPAVTVAGRGAIRSGVRRSCEQKHAS